MSLSIKIPPHNLDAEQAILGGVLINNAAMNQVMDIVVADDFYRDAHKTLFKGIIDLYNRNEPIDVTTLSQYLMAKNALDEVGGNEYLTSLADAVSTSAGIQFHAELVRELSLKRTMIMECSSISESCFQQSKSIAEVLEKAEQAIFDLTKSKSHKYFSPLGNVVKESFSDIKITLGHEGFITGVATGFTDFDKMTAGLQPSDLIIIAGRPSMGKTAFALNIAYNVAMKTGKGAAIFSLEMGKKQLGIRFLSCDAQIDAMKLRTGDLKDEEWDRLIDSAKSLSELPIYIDTSAMRVLEIKSKCRRLMKEQNIGVIIVDYLQLIQGKGKRVNLSEISRSLKGLAKELDVPVVAILQLNRNVEHRPNKRPQLSDLWESEAIEQDADVIAFMYRDEQYNPTTDENRNIAEIILAKQRNGPTGRFRLTFIKEYARFENYAEDDEVMLKPAQVSIKPGQFFINSRYDPELPIFGEILDIENLGHDEYEHKNINESYAQPQMKYYRLTKCYSAACPEGEIGDIHLSDVDAIIDGILFEYYKKNGWVKPLNSKP